MEWFPEQGRDQAQEEARSWFNCMCQSFGKAPFMVEFIVKGQSCRPAWLNWVLYWIACLTSVENGVLADKEGIPQCQARPDQRSRSCDLQPEEKADRKSGSVHCLPFPIVLKVHRLKQVISRGLFGLAPISNRKISLMKGFLRYGMSALVSAAVVLWQGLDHLATYPLRCTLAITGTWLDQLVRVVY